MKSFKKTSSFFMKIFLFSFLAISLSVSFTPEAQALGDLVQSAAHRAKRKAERGFDKARDHLDRAAKRTKKGYSQAESKVVFSAKQTKAIKDLKARIGTAKGEGMPVFWNNVSKTAGSLKTERGWMRERGLRPIFTPEGLTSFLKRNTGQYKFKYVLQPSGRVALLPYSTEHITHAMLANARIADGQVRVAIQNNPVVAGGRLSGVRLGPEDVLMADKFRALKSGHFVPNGEKNADLAESALRRQFGFQFGTVGKKPYNKAYRKGLVKVIGLGAKWSNPQNRRVLDKITFAVAHAY